MQVQGVCSLSAGPQAWTQQWQQLWLQGLLVWVRQCPRSCLVLPDLCQLSLQPLQPPVPQRRPRPLQLWWVGIACAHIHLQWDQHKARDMGGCGGGGKMLV